MIIDINKKHISLNDDVSNFAIKKFAKLDKFFKKEAKAYLSFSEIKSRKLVNLDATIKYEGMIFRAEVENHDIHTIVEKAVNIIERQIRKNKTKLRKRLHEDAFVIAEDETDVDETEYKIVRTKKFPIKPMNVEEATLQMDLIGHEFFMFLNSNTNKINVVYKRKSGDYGLIEPE